MPVDLKINGFVSKKICDVWKLTGPEVMSQNDGNPGQVSITHENMELPSSTKFNYICPAHSVVSIELDREV